MTQRGVLTVGLPPREIVSDSLLRRIQDDPTIKRRRVLQAHSWEMLCPVEHIGSRELGYDRRQYFRMSSVINVGGSFEQKADRGDALQLRMFQWFGMESTRLNSSDSPKARVMSGKDSMTEPAASSMSCSARTSFGLANSCSSENLYRNRKLNCVTDAGEKFLDCRWKECPSILSMMYVSGSKGSGSSKSRT